MTGHSIARTAVVALLALAACLLNACGSPSGQSDKSAEPSSAFSRASVVEASGSTSSSVSSSAASFASSSIPEPEEERPNFILLNTDDMDAASVQHMPRLRRILGEGGTEFENSFVTNSLCCPSRATLLRGQYTHNHGVRSNKPPEGGLFRFRKLHRERSTLATWLDDAGYRTALVGKYFNGAAAAPRHVPVGWDEWYEWIGNYESPAIKMNENGEITTYNSTLNHDTDVFSDRASDFIGRSTAGGQPFFLYLAPNSPHRPPRYPLRHTFSFGDADAPRPPSFNERDVSDKPRWVREKPLLDREEIEYVDSLQRGRLRELQAVDDMLGRLTGELEASGELDNTYILFTSDNGYHLGLHRLLIGKWSAYEEDIRVPLLIRGPGVPVDRDIQRLVLNNDIAPTIADLADIKTPAFTDGRSLGPLLEEDPPPRSRWRSAFLIEAAEGEDTGRPAYKALRTRNRLYVEYSNGEHELYNLEKDPYQLENGYENAPPALLRRLDSRLEALKGCEREECREAENSPNTRAGNNSRRGGSGDDG